MLALQGTIQGNAVVLNDDIRAYSGRDVIVTILDRPLRKRKKALDFDKYVTPTERGQHVEEYMEEMRDNDRI